MRAPHLHLLREHPGPPGGGRLGEGADLGLLVFLVAVHLAVLFGFLAGVGWGEGVGGYATAVVILAGRELVRELARRVWDSGERRGA